MNFDLEIELLKLVEKRVKASGGASGHFRVQGYAQIAVQQAQGGEDKT